MAKSKRQQYKPGAVVEIKLTNGKIAFGRLLPGVASTMAVYDFIIAQNEDYSIGGILNKPVLFYCGFYRDIITKGIFKIIGVQEFMEREIEEMPFVFFMQDMVNIDDCVIYGVVKEERKVKPAECIGLERSSVWDEQGIIQRIEDHYAGRRNFHVELDRVILSKDDPRYLPPPKMLVWDFEKQVFYRKDR